MVTQVTYDPQINTGYLYLVPLLEGFVFITEELSVNTDLILDIDKNGRVTGIEFQGDTARKLAHWSGKNGVFSEVVDKSGNKLLVFRIDQRQTKEIKFMFNDEIAFVFADKSYQNFVGLDILDMSRYSHFFLTE